MGIRPLRELDFFCRKSQVFTPFVRTKNFSGRGNNIYVKRLSRENENLQIFVEIGKN